MNYLRTIIERIKLNYSDQFTLLASPGMNPMHFYNITTQQCSTPVQREDTPKKRVKRLFSKEEDEVIRLLVMKFGLNHWPYIASQLNNRTARQVRERWKNYLCPGVNNPPWSEEEDEKLTDLVKKHGPQWSKIASEFGTRTDVHIKNRWALLQRKESRGDDRKEEPPVRNGVDEFLDEEWNSDGK